MDYSKAFQTKWFGGDGRSTIYIDNIFYFKGEPSGIENHHVEHEGVAIYDLLGRRVTDTSAHGIYVVNNKKIVK